MGIRIITDTTSDISIKQAAQMNITLIPLKVIFGDKEYKEGVDITIEGFYEKLVKAERLPTTSQPSPDDFLKHFKEGKAAGDSIIVLLIASKLSGTYQSAMIAKEMANYDDIYIIDSNTATCALRILVEQAVKLRDEGISAGDIASRLMDLRERIVFLAMLDTLEFLHKGGRLSKSSTILGTLLRFKPIITINDGTIGVIGKERGVNKAIGRIVEAIDEMGEIDNDYPVHLGYTAEDDQCRLLKDRLNSAYKLGDMKMHPVGCVVGTHAGPGACVITYVRK
ncbi:MAG: DegV family protein [Clostridiales bacterium]|jgi:DegV family protein with EDD domain|nr:DegV family protein [Clostridiales bacterium]